MGKTGSAIVGAACLLACVGVARAAVTPELQKVIRENTFEVVMKKPEKDPVSYEKPLPLDLLPYFERTDANRSIGTAFALGHNTYVTAAHVIAAGIDSQFGPPALRRSDGTVYDIDRILKYSIHEDFVVFSLRNDPAPTGFSVNRTPTIDEPVLAVGNALGEGIVIRDGLYTSETPEDQDGRWKWIRFSAAASPGNSGGPLCDDKGSVIGIVIGKSPNENLNYSMPISRALDSEPNKARFDQKFLLRLPYLHGSITYTYKDEFVLPLPWAGFVHAYQQVLEKNIDASQSRLLKTYAATAFPLGPGTDDIFFDAGINEVSPRFISQLDDGTWTAFHLDYHVVDLPGDGSVAAASAANVKLVRLIRPAAASDDAFYADSKAFMDLALKAMDFQRAVGQDKVRVTSLGRAQSEGIYTDAYGRKWQERVWAVPYADAYLIGLLLPTPDGYDALIGYAPSSVLYAVKKETRMVAAQVNLSYAGTLEQWQAMLHRTAFLPEALSAVKLTQTPDWTLATPRFASSVPSSVLTLTAKSPLTLTMGFIHDGERTRWDVEEVWWSKSNRHDEEVGVWRRPQPRPSAKLELRNRFGTILARRTPYDGTLNRETSEVYAASRVLDVRGANAGSVSSDLLYGVTLRTAGPPKGSETDVSLRSLTKLTRILETGNGEGKTPDLVGISSAENDPEALIQQRDTFEQSVRVWVDQGGPKGKDLRGRVLKDDVNEFIRDLNSAATPHLAATDPTAFREQMSKGALKLKLLGEYWQESLAIVHSREIWLEFLRRNHLPETRPHGPEVIAAEKVLLEELNAGTPKIVWAARARELHAMYLKERVQIAAALQPVIDTSNLTLRTDPCPPPATTNTGTNKPKVIGSSKSAEDYWPMESKRLAEEGNVVTGLKISATGCVIAKEIVVSSGSDMLDRAALEYVETIEFVPAAIDGKAVEATTPMRIIFKLKD
jgi:TonB family protein